MSSKILMSSRSHHYPFRHRAATRLVGYRHAVARAERTPASIYHANGKKAVTMGVSFIPVNVIDVGHALEAKLGQMSAEKPAGIHRPVLYDQAAEVGHLLTGLSLTF